MADIRRDWLTNQNMDWCFVVTGLVRRQSHSPLLQLKTDPVRQMGPPYWLAASGCQRIFTNIRGQYGIQKNIYIHPCAVPTVLLLRVVVSVSNISVSRRSCLNTVTPMSQARLGLDTPTSWSRLRLETLTSQSRHHTSHLRPS